MLNRRIDALVTSGDLESDIALRLKGKNQSADTNRAGMVWFCFFHPRLAGESGIERFFHHWGGEALYNSHEHDPIALLGKHAGLSFKIVRRFLKSRGFRTREPVDHEDRIRQPLPAGNIRRIVCFPEPSFCSLTGCAEWRHPLLVGNETSALR